mgnify:CR=1 FL=1
MFCGASYCTGILNKNLYLIFWLALNSLATSYGVILGYLSFSTWLINDQYHHSTRSDTGEYS